MTRSSNAIGAPSFLPGLWGVNAGCPVLGGPAPGAVRCRTFFSAWVLGGEKPGGFEERAELGCGGSDGLLGLVNVLLGVVEAAETVEAERELDAGIGAVRGDRQRAVETGHEGSVGGLRDE